MDMTCATLYMTGGAIVALYLAERTRRVCWAIARSNAQRGAAVALQAARTEAASALRKLELAVAELAHDGVAHQRDLASAELRYERLLRTRADDVRRLREEIWEATQARKAAEESEADLIAAAVVTRCGECGRIEPSPVRCLAPIATTTQGVTVTVRCGVCDLCVGGPRGVSVDPGVEAIV